MTTVLSRLDAAERERFRASGHWCDDTIFGLASAARDRDPSRVAVRERHRCVDHAALLDAADRLADGLRRLGLHPGARVGVWLPSRAEVAVVLLACARGGYVCAPSFHRDHTPKEVAALLDRLDAGCLITERGYGEPVGEDRPVVLLEPAEPGTDLFPMFPDAPGAAAAADADAVVYVAFTSGSTGLPKGVLHSHNTLLAPVRALRRDWSLGPADVVYAASPLSHNLGFGAMVLAVTSGAELVVHDVPRGAPLGARLAETGATFAFGVPTHAIDLLDELGAGSLTLPALRGFRISGAAVPPHVADGLLARGIVPQSGYGMTEAGSHHYTLPTDDRYTITETSGRPYDGYEVRIFATDDPDRPVPVGEAGQIGARGASLMLGYFDDQRATDHAFNADGWFMTGDLGVVDGEGRLRITGRKKDIIIRGGHNIYPARIEELAMSHPEVAKAAVVPVADARLGERACLVVAARPGTEPAGGALLDHLHEGGLARNDMPEYLVVLDELPLLASGKVAKLVLRDRLAAGELVPEPVRFVPPAAR